MSVRLSCVRHKAAGKQKLHFEWTAHAATFPFTCQDDTPGTLRHNQHTYLCIINQFEDDFGCRRSPRNIRVYFQLWICPVVPRSLHLSPYFSGRCCSLIKGCAGMKKMERKKKKNHEHDSKDDSRDLKSKQNAFAEYLAPLHVVLHHFFRHASLQTLSQMTYG